MKRILGTALILASLSVPVFAAKNSGSVTFANAVKVGSTELPPGVYKITWAGDGPTVQVTITENSKTVATAPAKVTPADNQYTAVSSSTVNGIQVLETIQFDKLNLNFTSTGN